MTIIIIGRHCMSSSSGYFNEKILLDLFPKAAIPPIGVWVVSSAGSMSTAKGEKEDTKKVQ